MPSLLLIIPAEHCESCPFRGCQDCKNQGGT